MQKEQLTKELIGAEVFNVIKGQGIVLKAEAGRDNVIITVQFTAETVSYSAILAVEKGVLIFKEGYYTEIIKTLKEVYEEERTKPITISPKKVSSNDDINNLVEEFIADQSITGHLIHLFKNEEFEEELFKLGTRLLVRKMDGFRLSLDELNLIVIFFAYIALKDYDGDLHGKIYSVVSAYSSQYVDEGHVRLAMYDVVNALKLREKVNYSDKKSYVAVPIGVACVPHYRAGQLFSIAYDIYKKKLLFDEDVTDQQIKEKIEETLAALKRNNYISKTAEDTIKGTTYLMSKYTQSCIYSGYNLSALIDIIAREIRLIINYLTKQEDAYIVEEFYKEGLKEWATLFENDISEKETYLKNRALSSPSFHMNPKHEVYLKTGAYCMDDTFDPYNVVLALYNGTELIQQYKLNGANDIEYNDEAIGGYKINSKKILLPQSCSPIDKLKYQLICGDKVLYDSQDRLYRDVLFFRATDGTEAKPGTDHIGEALIVISKDTNSDVYGEKIAVVSKHPKYYISQIIIENGDSYIFDDTPFIFRKVKEIEFFGYQIPWIKFYSMEKKIFPIYRNISVLLPSSCDKEDVIVCFDDCVLDFYNKDYRIYKYSQDNEGNFVYLVKILCSNVGYHQVTFLNRLTNKSIGRKKLSFVFDPDLHKENLAFSDVGQSFDLVSNFLKEPTSITYPYGTSLIQEKAYVPYLGHGDLYLFPSAPCYSIDGSIWIDIYKSLSLYEIDSSQRHIWVCGPEHMNISYVNDQGKTVKLDFERINENTYKIPLSFIRTQKDNKPAISFDYGNSNKQLKMFRLPFVSRLDCSLSSDGDYFEFQPTFTTTKALWLVVKLPNDDILLEKEVHSTDLVKLDKNTIAPNVNYITISIHSPGTSLFERYTSPAIKSVRYTLPNDVIISEDSDFQYNDDEKKLIANIYFSGVEQLKLSIYPTGIDYLLKEVIVKNGDVITIDVKHNLFASYHFVFESTSGTVKRIDRPHHHTYASSKYLKKTFDIRQFVFENDIEKNVFGLQYKFSNRFIVLNNEIYATGWIIKSSNPSETQEALLKMTLDPNSGKTFEVFRCKDLNAAEPNLRKFKINGRVLLKIKLL